LRSEEGDDVLAIGGGRGRGLARLGWRLVRGAPSSATFSQTILPVFLIQAVDAPGVFGDVFGRLDIAEEPWRKMAFESLDTAV